VSLRKLMLALPSIGLVILVLNAQALAWSNGPQGCNSFGTHDWILKKAVQHAQGAEWVRMKVALRATDDPDCKDGIDHASGTWWHVYDRWGDEWGGADEAAEVWHDRAWTRLTNGNNRGASRALGILAHIIGDVAQPMHTDSYPREDRVHSSYESAVDERIDRYRFTYDGYETVGPGSAVARTATAAHKHYWDLVRAYDRHGYNAKVNRITKRQLNRAANVLADLISLMG